MVKNMEEHVNARPLPKALVPPKPSPAADDSVKECGKAAILPPMEHSKFYFLCVTKRSPQVRISNVLGAHFEYIYCEASIRKYPITYPACMCALSS